MKKSFLISLVVLFFLSINIQPASAYVSGATTCCTLSTCFDVKGTCSVDSDCGSDEYCDYWGALCVGFGGPCKPLNCRDCQVAQNHQCVSGTAPAGSPDCCGYSCIEGGSLYDQTCYAYTNKLTDAANCGTCGNICTGGKVCTAGSCACPDGTEWDPVQNKCIAPTCADCIDGTKCEDIPVCSSATPGNRCVKNPITNYGELKADPTCVGCAATLNLNQQGTTNPCALKPSVSASGCAEGTDFEVRLGSTAACSGKISGGAGSCSQWTIVSSTTYDLWLNDNGWKNKNTKTADCWGGSGGGEPPPPPIVCNNNGVQDNGETGVDCGGGSCDACVSCPGTCGYISAWTGSCSTGCPASTPTQQWLCVPGLPGGCGGRSGCASYDPTKGETPCSPTCSGAFNICDKQSVCTATGCKNVCTDPSYPKDREPYCSKCSSCQDGILNCGETAIDKGGSNCGVPCTVSQTREYVKWSPSYCRDVCAGDGATCVGVMGSNGQYYPQGCSQGWTGNCKCSKTEDVFNPASCSDEVRNCAETCVDGGAQCNAGAKETDNTYAVSFEFSQPADLTGTNFYSDANSWNCADGIDNDKDCLVDCAEPACSL